MTSDVLAKHLGENSKMKIEKPTLGDFFARVPKLFIDSRNRRAVVSASVVMIAQ